MAQVTVELGQLLERTDFELFDFDYQFDDTAFKAEIEQHILDHYRFSEIGQETPDRFKHVFKTRFKALITYYNQLHNTTLLEYNPLINHSITDLMEQLTNTDSVQDTTQNVEGESLTNVDGSTTNNSTTQAEGTRTDDLKTNTTTDSDTTRTDNLEQTTTTDEETSDYPQQSESGSAYADTDRQQVSTTSNTGTVGTVDSGTSNSTNTGTVHDVGESTTNDTGTHESTTRGSNSSDTTGKTTATGNTDMSYDKKIEGLTGRTYQELIQLERANLVRIKAMIAEELKPCFIMVY